MKEQLARPYRTLGGPGMAELAIKRSRFLAVARPAADEAVVQGLLAGARAAHPDAGHHCFAYRLGRGGEMARFSDDGEPGGTAGRPMMEVLLREDVSQAVVVVTRYFGGVLLGSGGLTRAYSQAAADAVRAAGISAMLPHTEVRVTIDYTHLGALELALVTRSLTAGEKVYTDKVTILVPVPSGEEAGFSRLVADLTAGTGEVRTGRTIYVPE